jgi:hypothetical protein
MKNERLKTGCFQVASSSHGKPVGFLLIGKGEFLRRRMAV